MDSNPQPVDAKTLKFLRLLVTVLTGTMILGLLVIITLFVIKFSNTRAKLPSEITLPAGAKAQAITQGDSWYAVVTTDNRIFIYSRTTGTILQEIAVKTAE